MYVITPRTKMAMKPGDPGTLPGHPVFSEDDPGDPGVTPGDPKFVSTRKLFSALTSQKSAQPVEKKRIFPSPLQALEWPRIFW